MPARYRTCMECVPAARKVGWSTCRACGETLPSAALSGHTHCSHCTVDKMHGWRKCAKCGMRRP
eukprot:4097333-Prorocentrum_lima.AAC.1